MVIRPKLSDLNEAEGHIEISSSPHPLKVLRVEIDWKKWCPATHVIWGKETGTTWGPSWNRKYIHPNNSVVFVNVLMCVVTCNWRTITFLGCHHCGLLENTHIITDIKTCVKKQQLIFFQGSKSTVIKMQQKHPKPQFEQAEVIQLQARFCDRPFSLCFACPLQANPGCPTQTLNFTPHGIVVSLHHTVLHLNRILSDSPCKYSDLWVSCFSKCEFRERTLRLVLLGNVPWEYQMFTTSSD